MINESENSYNTIFIISDTYQLLQAIEWAVANSIVVKVFNTSDQLKLNSTDKVKIYRINAIDLYRTIDNVIHTLLDTDQHEFFRLLYDPTTEVHVFDNVELMFKRGLTDVHLHEAGESSYILSERTGYYGEDDPYTVAQYHMTEPIDDNDYDKCKRIKQRHIFKNLPREVKQQAFKVLGIKVPARPPKNTVLYIHNEPDQVRYTHSEILRVHELVEGLLRKLKDKGYTVWFKDHHKRPGGINTAGIVDKIIDCPVELMDTKQFAHVLSVRSKCVTHITGNCYNGLTREAVTKSKDNFMHVYERGIQKLLKYVDSN